MTLQLTMDIHIVQNVIKGGEKMKTNHTIYRMRDPRKDPYHLDIKALIHAKPETLDRIILSKLKDEIKKKGYESFQKVNSKDWWGSSNEEYIKFMAKREVYQEFFVILNELLSDKRTILKSQKK